MTIIARGPKFSTRGFHGMQAGGASSGLDAEEGADQQGEADRQRQRLPGDHDRHRRELADRQRDAPAQRAAQDHAQERDAQRFGQELGEDIAASRPDGAAQPDLRSPLAHGDQQDVHQHDAAHQQAESGQRGQQHGERPRGASNHFGDRQRRIDAEIVFQRRRDAVPGAHQRTICSICSAIRAASLVMIRTPPI
jgi:hypothetical protein